MKKQIGKPLMQKWKNKIGVRLSALDKKKLVLTNLPYALAAFYADRAFFLYRNSPGEDMGNKLLYAMEHADRIFAGFVLSNNWKDLLAGITVAVVLKVLVWQKQSDAKKLRKGIEYGSARWGNAEDIKPYMSENPWMNIPLTATEDIFAYNKSTEISESNNEISGKICVDNLDIAYGYDVPILKNISFTIEPGEKVFLMLINLVLQGRLFQVGKMKKVCLIYSCS